MMKRTSPHNQQASTYTVEVYVESDDKLGLTEKFTQFFAERHIGMASLSAQTIHKSKLGTETDHFHIAITAQVNGECNLMQLQEDFDTLCLHLDVRGALNFIKNSQ